MAKAITRPERFHRSRNVHTTLKFFQICVNVKAKLCHRPADALTVVKIESLTTSLVQEGPATALVVYRSGKDRTVDGKKYDLYDLVSGHRRHASISQAIDGNLDRQQFHNGMEVPVVVMEPGDDQSPEAFKQDVVIRSVLENEQREKLGIHERLEIVAEFQKLEVPKPRAASALSLSATQYERDARIVRLLWLHEAVKQGQIGHTDAAKLAEMAEKQGRLHQLERELNQWVREKEADLERERAEQKKLGRELKGPQNQIKKFLDAPTVKRWETALKEGRPFFEAPTEFNFGVVIDQVRKTIEIPKVSLSINDATSEQVSKVIAEMLAGSRQLVPVMKTLQMREQTSVVTDDEIEAELLRLQQAAREAAEAKAQEEAGRDPQEVDDSTPAAPQLFGGVIDDALDAAQGSQKVTEATSGDDDGDDDDGDDDDGDDDDGDDDDGDVDDGDVDDGDVDGGDVDGGDVDSSDDGGDEERRN